MLDGDGNIESLDSHASISNVNIKGDRVTVTVDAYVETPAGPYADRIKVELPKYDAERLFGVDRTN